MRLRASYDLKMAEQDKKVMERVARIMPLERVEALRAWALLTKMPMQPATLAWLITTEKAEMPMKNPPHPGSLIKTEVIEALSLSVSKAAEILQVRRATLSDLLNGKSALTPDMALRIEKAFGPEMDHLLRMQLAYDVSKTREQAKNISIDPYVPA